MENLTILIQWRGPFTIDEVINQDSGNGIYLLVGKQKYERETSIQYCGITEGNFGVRLAKHHKLPEINRDLEIWLGNIEYPSAHTRTHLETAESIIVYFWQPSLNERKKFNPPRPTTVISHWFKKNGDIRFNQMNIYKGLHDVLCWDGYYWRTGNLSVYENN